MKKKIPKLCDDYGAEDVRKELDDMMGSLDE